METRFLIWLSAFSLVGFAAVGVLNILVDPTSYLTNAHLVSVAVCQPGIRADERQSKAIAVMPFAPDALLVGTSQVGNGFDASDPILRETLGRTYNLGTGGLPISETDRLLRQSLPALNVRHVILGGSFGLMLDSGARRPASADEPAPPGLASLWALKDSVLSLNAAFASASALSSPRDCARPAERLDGTANYRNAALPPQLRERYEQMAVVQAKFDETAFRRVYSQNLASLEDLATYLCGHRVAVDFVLLPNHAWRLEIWSDIFGDARMDQWKRDVTGLAARLRGKGCAIAVWDFAYHNAVTTVDLDGPGAASPSFPYWEESHFRPAVGHRILLRILLHSKDDFGVELTPDTVEAQIVRAARARDDWRRSRPAAVAALAALVRNAPR